MQILIIAGPHSKVREIALSTRNLFFVGVALLVLICGASQILDSVNNQNKGIFDSIKKKYFSESSIASSEDNYETKLMEFQERLADMQRNLDQLDVLRTQLLRSTTQLSSINLGGIDLKKKNIEYVNPQEMDLDQFRSTLNRGKQDEQYGARLDKAVQESIVLYNNIQKTKKTLQLFRDIPSSRPNVDPFALMPQISSGLGYRMDPFSGASAWHKGADFPAAYGTPILSTADGVVLRATWDGEYGYVVDIEHKNSVVTRYAHAQELLVKKGDYVRRLQPIAKVGSSGKSTGPHLHYEVIRNGQNVHYKM